MPQYRYAKTAAKIHAPAIGSGTKIVAYRISAGNVASRSPAISAAVELKSFRPTSISIATETVDANSGTMIVVHSPFRMSCRQHRQE